MIVNEVLQSNDLLTVHSDDLPIALQLRARNSDLKIEFIPSTGDHSFSFSFDELDLVISSDSPRYDFYARTESSGEWQRIRVRSASATPTWQRYMRAELGMSPAVVHVYITRDGHLSLIKRNPLYLDHGERAFRQRHELTRLQMRQRSIQAAFTLDIEEPGEFHILKIFLALHSNTETHTRVAENFTYSKSGRRLSGDFRIDIPANSTLPPLKYSMYAVLHHQGSAQEVLVRLHHMSSVLYETLWSKRSTPRIKIQPGKVLAFGMPPSSTLASFIVRRESRGDREKARQFVYSTFARAESLVARALNWNPKPTALMYEKESATAQDNAFALFQYLLTAVPSPQFEFFFIMDSQSEQWKRVSHLPRVVRQYSLKYWRLVASHNAFLLASETRFHLANVYPEVGLLSRHLYRLKSYFLQHGVFGLKRVSIFRPDSSIFPDYTVASSEWEKRLLIEEGVKEDAIDITGIARWDRLSKPSMGRRRSILFMPTWRDWLEGHTSQEISQSFFFETLREFINSPKLAELLQRYNAELKFLPHPKFKDLSSELDIQNPHISTLHQDNIEFADLLQECEFVITDYSSIAWDFIFAKKSAVFFQFDLEQFQHSLGTFEDQEFNTLLNKIRKAETITTLLPVLETLLSSDPQALAEENSEVARSAFAYTDKNNSERILSHVESRLDELVRRRALPTYIEADSSYQKHVASTLQIHTSN